MICTIFYFNCEYFLFVYILKQKQKSSRFYKKNFVDFQNLMEIEFCWRLIFKIWIRHKPFLGSFEAPQNFCSRLLDANKQAPRQAKYK